MIDVRLLTDEELKKLQKIELELLVEFDRICRKYDIEYYLAGGTLLGAVRHKGFIPWDDDIDIVMTRNNYNKFIKYQKKELNSKKYYLDCNEVNEENRTLYAKLKRKNSSYVDIYSGEDRKNQKIWIDIFPLDNITDNKFIQKIYYFRVYALKLIAMYKYNYIKDNDKKGLLFLIKFFSIFFNKKRVYKKVRNLTQKYNNKKTNSYASFAGVYLGKEIFPKDYFKETIELYFENKKYPAPSKYDEYLTYVYGDYMTIPDPEDRVGHHYLEDIKFPKEKSEFTANSLSSEESFN